MNHARRTGIRNTTLSYRLLRNPASLLAKPPENGNETPHEESGKEPVDKDPETLDREKQKRKFVRSALVAFAGIILLVVGILIVTGGDSDDEGEDDDTPEVSQNGNEDIELVFPALASAEPETMDFGVITPATEFIDKIVRVQLTQNSAKLRFSGFNTGNPEEFEVLQDSCSVSAGLNEDEDCRIIVRWTPVEARNLEESFIRLDIKPLRNQRWDEFQLQIPLIGSKIPPAAAFGHHTGTD